MFGVLAVMLVLAVGAVLVLTVVVAIFAPGAGQGCEVVDGEGEPVGSSVGSLGGVAGSGITRAELDVVRSSRLAGSVLTTGVFRSTAYGPPWGGLQGPGVATAGGLRIDGGSPRLYVVAADPRVISLGQWVYAWPNPFGWRGPFLVADTGKAVTGRAIDFYDWRGRASQLRWNRRTSISDRPIDSVTVSDSRDGERLATPDAAAARAVARQLTGQPVGFALVDHGERVLSSVSPNVRVRSAAVTRTLVVIALTRQARDRALTGTERELATRMLRRADDRATAALYARVGAAAVDAVARSAGMTGFDRAGGGGPTHRHARVSVVDMARLFARIERLVAARHRDLALSLLDAAADDDGRFEALDAGLRAGVRSVGDRRAERDGGWMVLHAAQVAIGDTTYGFAVTLGKQQTAEAGAEAISAVARAAFTGGDAGLSGCGELALPPSSEIDERVGAIARRYLGMDARRQAFSRFAPQSTRVAWCAWFSTNVWRLAGLPVQVSAFSGYHYAWARRNKTLFKDIGSPPLGDVPPVGSALMYGSGAQSTRTSLHVNLVDTVNPDGSFMITGGNQDSSRVTRQGPCRMSRTDPARMTGPGCDRRPIYAIAAPGPAI